ncbi:MAG: GNAT family N-acetyltransferase [Mycobacteriales bacterium]
MNVQISIPTTQSGLSAVAKVLDDVFGVVFPATMFRVGFMHDLVRSDQLILLAGSEEEPLGAILALRARNHVEMPDMAVALRHQGRGIGRALFGAMTQWAVDEGFREIQWSVSPANVNGVAAYLAYGGRIVGWIDNAYGVASDAFYTGTTDRFRGAWRADKWPPAAESQLIHHEDHAQLRSLLLGGWHITGRRDDTYTVTR